MWLVACGDEGAVVCDAAAPPAPADNPTTDAGARLGEALFFDTALSVNGAVACATCHVPELAFTDGMITSTHGVTGTPLVRNTPTLITAAWSPLLFADGGAKNLESQALGPLTAADEMGNTDLAPMLTRLGGYSALFADAFADSTPTIAAVLRALAQYQRTLRPAHTRYDDAFCGDSNALTARERHGEALFVEHCVSCHVAPLFTDGGFHNNGLDIVLTEGPDGVGLGRARVTFDDADRGAFKTPTLRSIHRTAPYMHDGRFADLESVIAHYATGIVASPSRDARLPLGGFGFDAEQREALLAFLRVL